MDDFDGFFQRLTLEPGEYVVEIRLDGYQPSRDHILVSAGRTYNIRQSLKPLTAAEPEMDDHSMMEERSVEGSNTMSERDAKMNTHSNLAVIPDAPEPAGDSAASHDYWHALIPTPEAAEFDGVTVRKMEKDRQVGGGPKYIRLSARCIRYRRIDLREHAETLMIGSTAEPDPTP